MRQDIITQAIPHADPDFLQIMERLPEPPPASYEIVMKVLPTLYDLFLKKREAAAKNDTKTFMEIVEKEVVLLQKIEKAAEMRG